MSNPSQRLGEFVANLAPGDLPRAVVDRCKLVIMDTVAAILAGSAAPHHRNLARLAEYSSARGFCTLMGHTRSADARWAALVNATAGTSTELDEGNAFAKGHPAIHVIPAVLALAEERDLPGGEVLASIVAGYDVAARSGEACDLRPGVHPHGTWGTLGAAAAAARLMGLESAGIAQAIDIASSLTLATSFDTATAGATVRDVYAGMSNANGILAAELQTCGFTGAPDGIANVYGKVLADNFRPEALTEELGTRYEILRGYFKKHSCCRYNHAALDALELVRAKNAFGPAEVRTVRVESYRQAALLSGTEPTTTLAARFSVPYAVAIAIVRNSTTPAAFDATSLSDPQIRTLARKVQVSEDAEFTAMTPGRRPARVTVELLDGRTWSETVFSSRGDPDQPFTNEELVTKYLELSVPVIGIENAQAALNLIDHLGELPSIKPLMQCLRE